MWNGSIFVVLIGIISLGIDLRLYTVLSNPKIGSFYISIPCFIVAICAFLRNHRAATISISVFGIIGCIFGIIGSIVDGVAAQVLGSLVTCINKNGDVYGSENEANKETITICNFGLSVYEINDITCVTDVRDICYFYDGTVDGT